MLIFQKTTPQRYLTGISALNLSRGIKTDERRDGQISLEPQNPLNELFLDSSNSDLCIFDCAEILDAHGIFREGSSVWLATPARAIADMLRFLVSRNLSFDLILINEWTTWESKLELLQILDMELTFAPPEHKRRILDWIGQKEEEYRASIQVLIANGHAEDEKRIQAGELHPDSMFFISRERVKQLTIVWNNDPSLFDEI